MTMTREDVEHLPVKIRYVGEVLRTWASLKGAVDQWAVTVDGHPHVFDYYTGLGLRKGRNEPRQPKVADVLYSLLIDASAEQQNFHEWCSDYGHSLDSISALNVYIACLDTAAALRKCFSYELLAELNTLLAEY